ncbi:MAG: hypothetical protein ACREQQ_12930 [Candidatus Binatia bacterium]
MLEELATIVLTAALSSVFTLLLAERVLRARLRDAGDEIQKRVRAGALQAAEEMLPEVRDRVREGFEAAIASMASRSIGEALQDIAKSGGRIFGGLDGLFGKKKTS